MHELFVRYPLFSNPLHEMHMSILNAFLKLDDTSHDDTTFLFTQQIKIHTNKTWIRVIIYVGVAWIIYISIIWFLILNRPTKPHNICFAITIQVDTIFKVLNYF